MYKDGNGGDVLVHKVKILTVIKKNVCLRLEKKMFFPTE